MTTTAQRDGYKVMRKNDAEIGRYIYTRCGDEKRGTSLWYAVTRAAGSLHCDGARECRRFILSTAA